RRMCHPVSAEAYLELPCINGHTSAEIIDPVKACSIFLSLVVAALLGCDNKSEIKVYRVSKAPLEEASPEQQNAMPANAPSPSMPGGMAPVAPTSSVPTPPNWEPQPLSQMRQA